METLGDDLVAKSGKKMAFNFHCKKCDYNCFKKYNWDKHISTTKHIQVTVGDNLVAKVAKSGKNNTIYSCEICNKEYSSRNGLWKHKKICLIDQKTDNDISTKDLVLMLFQQNNKVQDAIIEMSKQINYTNNTTNTNSHNQTTNNSFNLQFFLNETCKNAMNITDFIDSIKLQLSDLINVGELGYVEGISNIIVKKLTALDVTERPVHCTDKKRETFYIKDKDKWEKDDNDKKIRKLIKNVAYKNQKLFPKFKENYPDYNNSNSQYSDQYSKIVIESLADGDIEKEDKIIKKISKVITIDKIKNNDI
jgi:protein-tyrosine phosphatase